MWYAKSAPKMRLDDVADFTARLDESLAPIRHIFRDFLPCREPVFLSRAPGRLDVMGGIADYSGARVLQWPLAEATIITAEKRTDRRFRVVSLDPDAKAPPRIFETDLSGDGAPILGDYAEARAFFADPRERQWAGYILGILTVLAREKNFIAPHGADILSHSHVPEGKGVSSSAALEVAAEMALAALYGIAIEAREGAILAQKVENLVVGAPCGIMDQMASMCGESGRLLKLSCRPAEIEGYVELPENVAFFGIDSGVRHSVGAGDYGQVRTAAFMGHRIITSILGCRAYEASGRWTIEDDPFHGYLTAIPLERFVADFAERLPVSLNGRRFLDLYGGTIDPVTKVDPARDYPVRAAAAHPVHEAHRIARFERALSTRTRTPDFAALGALMEASHASYSSCGLGSDGTDRLVELVREAGPAKGVFGAKITGGGNGGTVAVVGTRSARSAVQEIARRYAGETNKVVRVFTDSSPGAYAFGTIRLERR